MSDTEKTAADRVEAWLDDDHEWPVPMTDFGHAIYSDLRDLIGTVRDMERRS